MNPYQIPFTDYIPFNEFIPPPPIRGDPATRRFGLFLLSVLAVLTIGSLVGIAAGNIAHYKYFGPHNATNVSSGLLSNITFFQRS